MERLKELRRERVLSLRELEERSGVSYNTIWRLEDGRQGAHPRTVRKLAEAATSFCLAMPQEEVNRLAPVGLNRN